MRRRLSALLLVAAVSGAIASTVSANQETVAAAAPGGVPRIPPLPRLAEIGKVCPLPAQYRPVFEAAARATDLPLALLVAVGRIESNLRVDARSLADARGLMQVLPSTAQELGLDADEPTSNVLAGARYLKLQFARFRSSDLALAAYNAGPTAVAKAGGAPSFVTLNYVANVTTTWRALQGCR
jgi:soluble lytic murein transglycosylase-like protein